MGVESKLHQTRPRYQTASHLRSSCDLAYLSIPFLLMISFGILLICDILRATLLALPKRKSGLFNFGRGRCMLSIYKYKKNQLVDVNQDNYIND